MPRAVSCVEDHVRRRRIRYECHYERKRQVETLLKLRNREDSFVMRAAQRGCRVTPVRHLELTEQGISADGSFDFAVIAEAAKKGQVVTVKI